MLQTCPEEVSRQVAAGGWTLASILCVQSTQTEQKAKCKLNQSLEEILVFDHDGCISQLLWENIQQHSCKFASCR